jgi:hypothetical protein
VQAEMDFSAAEARADLQDLLEQFLARHSSVNDLGLRLHGEQLAAGVRFVRLLKEGTYDLVVANPPYIGSGKLPDSIELQKPYPDSYQDHCTIFIDRALELAKPRGTAALLTLNNWMFLKSFSQFRKMISSRGIICLLELGKAAFSTGGTLISTVASILSPRDIGNLSIGVRSFDCYEPRRDEHQPLRTQAAVLSQEGLHRFDPNALKVVPEHPLVYWWDKEQLLLFEIHPLLEDRFPTRKGLCTSNDLRYCRRPWEVALSLALQPNDTLSFNRSCISSHRWLPFVTGGKGRAWIEPLNDVVLWENHGLDNKVQNEWICGSYTKRVPSESYYLKRGVAFSMIGSDFCARIHRYPSIFGNKGASVFPEDVEGLACVLNSSISRYILSSVNPGVGFEVGDVNRLPIIPFPDGEKVYDRLSLAFAGHEAAREASVEFVRPGHSSWVSAQKWAQKAVDRPEGEPLPEFIEELDSESSTDHLSFALGLALGRFAPVDEHSHPTTSNPPGVLDPATANLSHAFPAGILFLDGSLEENDHRDDLGQAAAAPYINPGPAMDPPSPEIEACATGCDWTSSRMCTRACMRADRSTGR